MNPIRHMNPIGYASTWFKTKNGTPRQPTICPLSRGSINILKEFFSNPEHALEGLESYSHVWIIFLFHRNGSVATKAKVAPPRLGGKRVGLFSTRTPHRPNPIGLTLAKLESISGSTVHLSGLDLLDGTPILDIKPYIPSYDSPSRFTNSVSETSPSPAQFCLPETDCEGDCVDPDLVGPNDSETTFHSGAVADVGNVDKLPSSPKMEGDTYAPDLSTCTSEETKGGTIETPASLQSPDHRTRQDETRTPVWTADKLLPVSFTDKALLDLNNFNLDNPDPNFRLSFLKNTEEARLSIVNILSQDPRSVYRKTKCLDRLYFFMVDNMHVTSWFDDEINTWQVLRIVPIAIRKKHANLPSSLHQPV